MRAIQAVLALAVVTVAACGTKPEVATNQAAGTAGAQMPMQGMQMMPLMRAHLDSVSAMPAAQMAAIMPAHVALATRTMDAMGGDMRDSNVRPDTVWTALRDSVRLDLTEMPALTGPALTTRMQAHAARMQRMMVMHGGMMHR